MSVHTIRYTIFCIFTIFFIYIGIFTKKISFFRDFFTKISITSFFSAINLCFSLHFIISYAGGFIKLIHGEAFSALFVMGIMLLTHVMCRNVRNLLPENVENRSSFSRKLLQSILMNFPQGILLYIFILYFSRKSMFYIFFMCVYNFAMGLKDGKKSRLLMAAAFLQPAGGFLFGLIYKTAPSVEFFSIICLICGGLMMDLTLQKLFETVKSEERIKYERGLAIGLGFAAAVLTVVT